MKKQTASKNRSGASWASRQQLGTDDLSKKPATSSSNRLVSKTFEIPSARVEPAPVEQPRFKEMWEQQERERNDRESQLMIDMKLFRMAPWKLPFERRRQLALILKNEARRQFRKLFR